ncbi:hydroxyacid-oxoacid transhydrogenase [Microbotryum lychnidis-dioicae p1A1 Lamole]|uniref:hydroxyacid-oxoacid transhydrogenase n=1 Tax=Microbotryum lychnidis-dioicae (strain p1A1 Lamole / MvSl-1064) TaxID=683840 RepID=U5HF20_USTV1|nr:hydroxyacid-oxoacid transhydrogenase [Microbotryum lychnidis-dioicae p1A1 Lamole]|eukprot:KDE03823.1 hydroxyacid-oxoacid transhydrogenase [Microbotryum lychnidis-dioicae p1A1 Lamole]
MTSPDAALSPFLSFPTRSSNTTSHNPKRLPNMPRPPVASRQVVQSLLQRTHKTHCGCSLCSTAKNSTLDILNASKAIQSGGQARTYATPVDAPQTEYAFEVAASNLRFGEGVTREVGMDFANQKARKVGVFTDATVSKLLPMKMAIESLEAANVPYEVYDKIRVEPNQTSWQAAIDFAKHHDFSHFLAVGGGSVIDTCKVANLFVCHPEAELLDFVNAPVGKGKPINKTLRPLIAVPTTAGTGSETTGTAIFDYSPLSAKTGIANRALRPLLGIVDPLNTDSCPRAVHISSGLDVLFHALESWTAISYLDRLPRPSNPLLRPAYQGRNPVSDVFSEWALRQTVKYLPRVAADGSDKEAKSSMLLASTFAGIGFGNAGVHLCHGISYPISGLNYSKGRYQHPGYEVDHPIVPHGISVALTGPAVFNFTAPSAPDRHRQAAEIFNEFQPDGIDIKRIKDEDVGMLLHDRIARFLVGLDVPRGLNAVGYKSADVDELVLGTLPQRRVLDLAPGFTGNEGKEELGRIIEQAMSF